MNIFSINWRLPYFSFYIIPCAIFQSFFLSRFSILRWAHTNNLNWVQFNGKIERNAANHLEIELRVFISIRFIRLLNFFPCCYTHQMNGFIFYLLFFGERWFRDSFRSSDFEGTTTFVIAYLNNKKNAFFWNARTYSSH